MKNKVTVKKELQQKYFVESKKTGGTAKGFLVVKA